MKMWCGADEVFGRGAKQFFGEGLEEGDCFSHMCAHIFVEDFCCACSLREEEKEDRGVGGAAKRLRNSYHTFLSTSFGVTHTHTRFMLTFAFHLFFEFFFLRNFVRRWSARIFLIRVDFYSISRFVLGLFVARATNSLNVCTRKMGKNIW